MAQSVLYGEVLLGQVFQSDRRGRATAAKPTPAAKPNRVLRMTLEAKLNLFSYWLLEYGIIDRGVDFDPGKLLRDHQRRS